MQENGTPAKQFTALLKMYLICTTGLRNGGVFLHVLADVILPEKDFGGPYVKF